MSLDRSQISPVMCITQDGLPLSHLEQTRRLCAAGATWIQLRMKTVEPAVQLDVATEVVAICRVHGTICIINDDLELALASRADGVHLGRTDGSWSDARRQLGPDRILGGTVNNAADADAVSAAGCLDYVGVGPWRFTANKKNLSPILGPEGIRALVARLDGLPVWAIGGIEGNDLPLVRATGAVGAAVSSVLFRHGTVEENYRALRAAWEMKASHS
jgi:thiamine-phosphate pyrophosphorylase